MVMIALASYGMIGYRFLWEIYPFVGGVCGCLRGGGVILEAVAWVSAIAVLRGTGLVHRNYQLTSGKPGFTWFLGIWVFGNFWIHIALLYLCLTLRTLPGAVGLLSFPPLFVIFLLLLGPGGSPFSLYEPLVFAIVAGRAKSSSERREHLPDSVAEV